MTITSGNAKVSPFVAGLRQSLQECRRQAFNRVGGRCESFFATLECELLDRHRFRSHREARMAVFHFSKGVYNPSRRRAALGYLSPIEYERKHYELTPSSREQSTKPGQIQLQPQ